MEAELKALLEEHVAETGSPRGQDVLTQWADMLEKFWHVAPNTKPLKERSQALVHVPLWSARTKVVSSSSTNFLPLLPAKQAAKKKDFE